VAILGFLLIRGCSRVEKFPSPEGLGNFRRKFPEKVEIFGKFWKYLGKSGNF
jgi:hypothetical protein